MAPSPASRAKLLLPLLAGAAIPSYAQQCLGAYKAETTYIGCYTDNGDFRTLQAPPVAFTETNTPQVCADQCGQAGFNISGVEFTFQCFCGYRIEDSAVHVAETDCSSPCPGDSSLKCGNGNRMNLYRITNPDPIVTLNAAVPNCLRDPLCSTGLCDTTVSIPDRASKVVANLTLAEKIAALNNGSPGIPRLGIPPYQWWSEALHGVASGNPGVTFQHVPLNYSGATAFPCPINLGATFNLNLYDQIGLIIGTEARAYANTGLAGLTFFTPNTNLFRNPRWGRGQETPGEDPFLTGQYSAVLINGLQGQNAEYMLVLATCKHFFGYDVEDNRLALDVNITRQNMADFYLPSFEACVKEGHAGSVMCAYTAVNGHPSCAFEWLLEDVLRDTYGFTEPWNYVVSDCDAVDSMVTGTRLERNGATAAADTMNAGMDLDCGATVSNNLKSALQQGLITEDVLDRSLGRLFAALIKTGFFNQPEQLSSLSWKDVNTPASQAAAYTAAAQSIVLLKNTGALPVTSAPGSVLVVGPYGNATMQMQGNYAGIAVIDILSPLLALEKTWPSAKIQFAQGVDIDSADTSRIAAAVSAARDVDVVIFFGGPDRSVEDEAKDRQSLAWPGKQQECIDQVSQVAKKMIVVQFGGGQVDDSSILANGKIGGLLWAGYPGQSGGQAIADTITGANPPAGRLPSTQYPAGFNDAYDPLNMDIRSGAGQTYMWHRGDVVFPFGYGLHYTNFTLAPSGTRVSGGDIASLPESLTVSYDVTNTGSRASDYVALLFHSSPSGPDASPIKRLVAFDRVLSIKPGQTVTVDLFLETKQFARADANGDSWIYPGLNFLFLDVGDSTAQVFTLTGDAKKMSALPPQ